MCVQASMWWRQYRAELFGVKISKLLTTKQENFYTFTPSFHLVVRYGCLLFFLLSHQSSQKLLPRGGVGAYCCYIDTHTVIRALTKTGANPGASPTALLSPTMAPSWSSSSAAPFNAPFPAFPYLQMTEDRLQTGVYNWCSNDPAFHVAQTI